MKRKNLQAFLTACTALATAASLQGQTWNATTADFRVGSNWNPAVVPGSANTASIDNGGTALIAAGLDLKVGNLLLGGDGSGSSNRSGNLTQSGAVLILSPLKTAPAVVGNTALNSDTVTTSVLRIDGGEIQIDDPAGVTSLKQGFSKSFDFDDTGTNDWASSGLNNADLLVGIGSRARLELHDAAELFLGDDLGLANTGSALYQEATLEMDGTSLLAIGSGAEVGKTHASVTINLAGSAIFAAGNSLGPGNPAGQTDEGYFTIGTRDTGNQTVSISDNAELQCMTLQNRQGTTNINLTGSGKLKIHNVFTGSGTILATRPSYLSSGAAVTTLSLRGTSVMLVDCLLGNVASGGSNGVNGLHVSGGENLQSGITSDPNTYNSTSGGYCVLDVGDDALLDIKQGLHLGFGNSTSSDATLRTTGPGATVAIGGNLNLAFNEYVDQLVPGNGSRPGTGALEFVFTGANHKPITVAGAARITNGTLRLNLQGYTPPRGTTYTLIQAGSVEGPFGVVDLSAAPLTGNDVWSIKTTATTVTATVSAPFLNIGVEAGVAIVSWTGPGVLQFSPDLATPFVDVPFASSPYFTALDAAKKFFRLRY